MERDEARQALSGAAELQDRVRRQTRQYGYAAFLAGLGVLAATLGVAAVQDDPTTRGGMTMIVFGIAGAMIIFASTRRALPRRFLAMHLVIIVGGIALLHTLTLTLGITVFAGQWAWWIAGAVASALPAFAVAFLTLRSARS